MDHREFLKLARETFDARPQFPVDRVEVSSEREISALGEWFDKGERDSTSIFQSTNTLGETFGIPIVFNDAVPNGVIRLLKEGEIIGDIAVT